MSRITLGVSEHSRGRTSPRRGKLLRAFVTILMTGGFAAPAAAQQTGRVTGLVIDSLSRAPLAGVQVYLEGSTLGALTRQNGRYVILGVPPGRYQLRAERIGMTQAARPIVLDPGGTVEADFALEVKALGLDEIVVT